MNTSTRGKTPGFLAQPYDVAVLHLRVICPADQSAAISGLLLADPGVAHVLVVPGAALNPAGDLIEADVARESADEVLAALRGRGIVHSGAITVEPLEMVLSDAAAKARQAEPGDEADIVVWEELRARTRDESTLNVTYLAFLTIACLLAVIGVVTDSAVTLVGAMVVGPEFGPLAAAAVAIVRVDLSLARRSLIALIAGFPIAMAIAVAATLLWKQLGWITVDTIKDLRNVDFVYQVGPFSLVVALLAGAAGMLALVSAKSAALVGVFISVTTVPAAGFAVVAATVGEWHIALMSAGQLGINLAGIVIAGVAVLGIQLLVGKQPAAAALLARQRDAGRLSAGRR